MRHAPTEANASVSRRHRASSRSPRGAVHRDRRLPGPPLRASCAHSRRWSNPRGVRRRARSSAAARHPTAATNRLPHKLNIVWL